MNSALSLLFSFCQRSETISLKSKRVNQRLRFSHSLLASLPIFLTLSSYCFSQDDLNMQTTHLLTTHTCSPLSSEYFVCFPKIDSSLGSGVSSSDAFKFGHFPADTVSGPAVDTHVFRYAYSNPSTSANTVFCLVSHEKPLTSLLLFNILQPSLH